VKEDDIEALMKVYSRCHESSGKVGENSQPQFIYCHDIDAVERRLRLASKQKDRGQLVDILKKVSLCKGRNFLASMPANYTSVLQDFANRYPHFSALSEYLRGTMALSALSEHPVFSLDTPLLLNGPPGIGKTHAVDFLASRLGTTSRVVSCSDQSNGFDLTGLSSGWGTGQPGMIAEMLIEEGCSNPVIVLDEVDKASKGDDKSPFEKSLYRLLEKETAGHFVDEYLKVELDASQVNWMATSNEIEPISSPIRDRFLVLELREPTLDERLGIIRSLYTDLLEQNSWGKCFSPELSPEVVAMLADSYGMSIRDMKKVLRRASSLSALRGRLHDVGMDLEITTDDMRESLEVTHSAVMNSNRIGFV